MEKDYYLLVICYERNGVYSHTVRTLKSNALGVIELWSRNKNGLCELIDMKMVVDDIKSGKIKDDE